MGGKSMREMSTKQRRYHSLTRRTVRATMMDCVLLGMISLVIGVWFYGLAMVQQHINLASNIASYRVLVCMMGDKSKANIPRSIPGLTG